MGSECVGDDELHRSSSSSSFGCGWMRVGSELEVAEVTSLEQVWACQQAAFFRPSNLPAGFHCVGHYARPSGVPTGGAAALLAVRQRSDRGDALKRPLGYTGAWSNTRGGAATSNGAATASGAATFWLPVPPAGYAALGYVVSGAAAAPAIDEVMCVRADLTTACAAAHLICSPPQPPSNLLASFCRRNTASAAATRLSVWGTRPVDATGGGLPMGTFVLTPSPAVATLVNAGPGPVNDAMPSQEQIGDLMRRYAPILRLHPDEAYFPSSVSWFFQHGALLYSSASGAAGTPVQPPDGANLPAGGNNDGSYWLDLPADESAAAVARAGDVASATAYVHAKPMLGGAATDLQLWMFYPFNGAATLRLTFLNLHLAHIGEHVGDWEHVTLRVSNLTARLERVYLAAHSGGVWLRPDELEYDSGTGRAVVYASKHGHAAYAHPGEHLQGDPRAGVGIRNDTAAGGAAVDLGANFTLLSAPFLVPPPPEPRWLDFAHEWGPKLQYNSRAELDRLLKRLPKPLRRRLSQFIDRFPNELSGEEGPTGPKFKDYWLGDER